MVNLKEMATEHSSATYKITIMCHFPEFKNTVMSQSENLDLERWAKNMVVGMPVHSMTILHLGASPSQQIVKCGATHLLFTPQK